MRKCMGNLWETYDGKISEARKMMQVGSFQAIRWLPCLQEAPGHILRCESRKRWNVGGKTSARAVNGDSQKITGDSRGKAKSQDISRPLGSPRPLFRVKSLQATPNLVEHVVARCDPPSVRNRPWLDTNIKTLDVSQLSQSLLPGCTVIKLRVFDWVILFVFCLENNYR